MKEISPTNGAHLPHYLQDFHKSQVDFEYLNHQQRYFELFPVGFGMTFNLSSRYLELAEDAEELGEGSRYRSNETVREPWNMIFHDGQQSPSNVFLTCATRPRKVKQLQF